MSKCAFIGLGNMGYPMAGHLATAGHDIVVFNRTSAKASRWEDEHDGSAAATPGEAANGARFVFVCVGGDDDVRGVLYGDGGVLEGLDPGAVVVDHTTASATLALEAAAACAERGVGFLDAPISGGQAGAENGVLSIMCGGEQVHFDAASPVMNAYAGSMILIGGAGSGQRTKMVNQILCAGAIQGAAEALAFGERAGLDMEKVLAAVSKGAAGSWYLSNRGSTMVADEFDFGFAVDWLAKDLGLVADEAQKLGADTPLTALTTGHMTKRQEAGDNRLDATSIIRNYRD